MDDDGLEYVSGVTQAKTPSIRHIIHLAWSTSVLTRENISAPVRLGDVGVGTGVETEDWVRAVDGSSVENVEEVGEEPPPPPSPPPQAVRVIVPASKKRVASDCFQFVFLAGFMLLLLESIDLG